MRMAVLAMYDVIELSLMDWKRSMFAERSFSGVVMSLNIPHGLSVHEADIHVIECSLMA